MEQTEALKVKTRAEDAKILEEYIRIRDDAIAQKEAIRVSKLNSGKHIQEYHLKQIVLEFNNYRLKISDEKRRRKRELTPKLSQKIMNAWRKRKNY